MKILALALLLTAVVVHAAELVEYRLTLEVTQKPVSAQAAGYGATQTNKANARHTVALRPETVVSVFNQTSVPAYGKLLDKNLVMRKDVVMTETTADAVAKCAFDNLSWPYKNLQLGMTRREGADWVLLDGEFRSERIYEDCSSAANENMYHTYTQENEKVNFGIKLEPGQIYSYTFKSSRIPTRLIVERLK